jgi:hypothetical protein
LYFEYTEVYEIKAREYRRGNLKKGDNPEKLATYRVHKTMKNKNKNTTQYVLDTTMFLWIIPLLQISPSVFSSLYFI